MADNRGQELLDLDEHIAATLAHASIMQTKRFSPEKVVDRYLEILKELRERKHRQ